MPPPRTTLQVLLVLALVLAPGVVRGAPPKGDEVPPAAGPAAAPAPVSSAPVYTRKSPPPGNNPRARKPPQRPQAGDAKERAAALVRALREDRPELALPFFFPADAFRLVKGIKDPDRYYKRLVRIYLDDVRAMRRTLRHPEQVELLDFQLSRRGKWMERGREANALPYWTSYKSKVVVRDGERELVLPVRVMITWDERWYVTHLTNK